MPAPLEVISPPVVHHVKYLERHEVVLALRRGAWTTPRGEPMEIRDASRGTHMFTWVTSKSQPSLFNSYGGLVFSFTKRLQDGVTTISAHDTSRRSDMRGSTTVPYTEELTCDLALSDGHHANLSISGPLLGDGGSTLLLDGSTPAVVVSRAPPASAEAVQADNETYFISVAPGFDVSLAVAACLIFEELQGRSL